MYRRSFDLAVHVSVVTLAFGLGGLLLSSCGGDDASAGKKPDASVGGAAGSGGSGVGGSGGAAGAGGASGAGVGGVGGVGGVEGGVAGSGGEAGGETDGGPEDSGADTGPNEASLEITPAAGGTLTFGSTTVTVPAGAVSQPTTITLKSVDPASVAGLPSNFVSVGPMVALLPHGLTFSQPVTVTLGHTSTAPTSTLGVLSLDDEADTSWESVSQPTITATTATFQTTTFSIKVPTWSGATLYYQQPGAVPVGHIALGGGKLFYSLAPSITINSVIDILSIDLGSSGPATTVSTFPLSNSGTNALLTTPSTLFFAAGQNVYSVPLAGGTLTTAPIPCAAGIFDSSLTHGIPRLVADSAMLYCTTLGASAVGELKSFGFTGSPLTTVSNLQAPRVIALDGNDILYSASGGILRIANTLTGPTTTVIASSEFGTGASPYGLVHDSSFIYVLTTSVASTAVLWRKPKLGGPLEAVTAPLATMPGGARGLLLVDQNFYFVKKIPNSQGGSLLQKIAKTANAGVPLDLGGANSSNLATDGTYVYYANGTEILTIPK
jgi:hypothetical protein